MSETTDKIDEADVQIHDYTRIDAIDACEHSGPIEGPCEEPAAYVLAVEGEAETATLALCEEHANVDTPDYRQELIETPVGPEMHEVCTECGAHELVAEEIEHEDDCSKVMDE